MSSLPNGHRTTQSFTVGEPVHTHVKVPESNSLSQITFSWGSWKSELFSKAANAESFVDQALPWQPGLSVLILCFLFLAPTHCCFPSLISHKHLHHFLTFYQVHVCHWLERAPKILGNILLHPWLHLECQPSKHSASHSWYANWTKHF